MRIADYTMPRACWRCTAVGEPTLDDCAVCRDAHTETVKVISTGTGGGTKALIEIYGELRVVPMKMLRHIREEATAK